MVSSGATSPARAPPSIDMLHTVMRSSMLRARMALPVYSNTLPVPPPTPILAISARMMSLAETPGRSRAIHADLKGLRFPLQQALRGQHVLHFAGADAEGQRAERAMRGRVAVAADHRHAGLRQAQLRPDHVDDALAVAVHAQAADAEFGAVGLELRELLGGDLIHDGQRAVGGRNAVIGRGDGEIRTPHLQAALAQSLEGLRRSDFMNQVQVDEEQRGSAGLFVRLRGSPRVFR